MDEETVFCSEEFQQINAEGMIGLEIAFPIHFSSSNEITDSGKDHQWILKLKGKRLLGNWVFSVEMSASDYDRSQGKKHNFAVN